MANSERRYEPTIDLQGFDLTMNMDAVHEPSRLPLIVGIALVVLAAFAGVVWLAYTQGVERGRESVSRELTAQQFWKLRKPAVPAYTGLKIYEPPNAVEQGASANPSSPTKQAAATKIPSLRPTASAAPETPAPITPIAAKPVPGTGVAPAASRSEKAPAGEPAIKSRAAVPTEAPQRVATRAPTELTTPAAPPPATTHPLTEPDSLAPPPPSTPPAAKGPALPAVNVPAPPERKSVTAAPTASASTSAPAPAAAGTHVAPGGILLQIGSYKSDVEARASWQTFKSEHDA